jgi:hypothetical protein
MKKNLILLCFIFLSITGLAQTNTLAETPKLAVMESVPDSVKKTSDKKPELKQTDVNTIIEEDTKSKNNAGTNATPQLQNTTIPKKEE